MNKVLKSHIKNVLQEAHKAKLATHLSLKIGSFDSEKIINIHEGQACEQSFYDLASLTKILGTAMAVAMAIDEGRLSLKECPFSGWPKLTIESLLNHSSGHKAHIKFYEDKNLTRYNFLANKETIYEQLFALKPEFELGQKKIYSDLNFMALAYLLEKTYQTDLWTIFNKAWSKAKLSTLDLAFLPSSSSKNSMKKIVSTGTWPQARVHDDNCFMMGGLSGHAGLFGTSATVFLLGQYFLRCFYGPQNRFEKVLQYFAKNYLAFFPAEQKGSTRAFSNRTFGHFGFSGTALWVDPLANHGQGLVVSFLTNRVFCKTSAEEIYILRKKIFALAVKAFS